MRSGTNRFSDRGPGPASTRHTLFGSVLYLGALLGSALLIAALTSMSFTGGS